MNEKQWLAWLLGLGAAVGGALWFFLLRGAPQAPPPAVAAVSAPAPAASPEPLHPLPVPAAEDPAAEPLPALGESDALFHPALAALLGGVDNSVLLREQLIRRLVIAVDNLPRERVGLRDWPVRRTGGSLVVTGESGVFTLSAENDLRYNLAMAGLQQLDLDALVRLYVRYYPLFNAAYRELGYPDGHFNDRLVQVIDHLLAAPAPRPPILLLRPKVYYEFLEPALESLSFGQKLMIRIGPDNRAVVEDRLRGLRSRVAAADPGGPR